MFSVALRSFAIGPRDQRIVDLLQKLATAGAAEGTIATEITRKLQELAAPERGLTKMRASLPRRQGRRDHMSQKCHFCDTFH